jgi:hypothetical protein
LFYSEKKGKVCEEYGVRRVGDFLAIPPDAEDDFTYDYGGAPSAAERNRVTAEYLTDMIAQLESMARTGGLDLVAYLLAMARVEAGSNARAPGLGAAPQLSGR